MWGSKREAANWFLLNRLQPIEMSRRDSVTTRENSVTTDYVETM